MRLLREPAKYKSTIGFTDLLFNLLVGFVFLFIIAFILINPITKKKDVPKKAEYMVVIEWESTSLDDIDLWVKAPDGKTVSFVKKEAGLMNLEKDDLGISNDFISLSSKIPERIVSRLLGDSKLKSCILLSTIAGPNHFSGRQTIFSLLLLICLQYHEQV